MCKRYFDFVSIQKWPKLAKTVEKEKKRKKKRHWLIIDAYYIEINIA